MSLLLPYQVFNLQFEYYDCTQSWIHLRKWLDSKLQPYAHTFIAPRLSMCSTFNRPPGYTIWEMLKDILLSFVILSFFFKCAAMHNDGVGKILPYYPIKVRTSESAAFIFRQLVSCTIFILFWEMLLRDAALPSAGEPTGRAGRSKCSALLRPLSLSLSL